MISRKDPINHHKNPPLKVLPVKPVIVDASAHPVVLKTFVKFDPEMRIISEHHHRLTKEKKKKIKTCKKRVKPDRNPS